MKAYVLHEINDYRLEDIRIPEIGEKEVLVKVKAAGICGSDIPRIYTSGTYHYPLVPGHEFSGEVVLVGENADKAWLNKRVGVFPLIPCRECSPCQKEQYELCKNYSYLGSRTDGGFAEYVKVPEWNLIALPDKVSFQAAAMMEPMAVAVHAMRKAEPHREDRIVVCGLGTIGLLLTMFLLDAGMTNIYVIGNKELQREKALAIGIQKEYYCDQRTEDVNQWIMDKTNTQGMDVYFECVGKNDTLVQAIANTAPNGKVQLVGNPYSDMNLEKSVYWKILRNQLTILGTWNSSFRRSPQDDWHYVLNRILEGGVNPELLITQRYNMEDMLTGFKLMREKSQEFIKVMGEFR